MYAAFANDNPLFVLLNGIRDSLESQPWGTLREIKKPGLVLEVEYDTDNDGDDYAQVGFMFPDEIYAVIEDGTYGQLQGLRIYR